MIMMFQVSLCREKAMKQKKENGSKESSFYAHQIFSGPRHRCLCSRILWCPTVRCKSHQVTPRGTRPSPSDIDSDLSGTWVDGQKNLKDMYFKSGIFSSAFLLHVTTCYYTRYCQFDMSHVVAVFGECQVPLGRHAVLQVSRIRGDKVHAMLLTKALAA